METLKLQPWRLEQRETAMEISAICNWEVGDKQGLSSHNFINITNLRDQHYSSILIVLFTLYQFSSDLRFPLPHDFSKNSFRFDFTSPATLPQGGAAALAI
ncbi:hypothetical protein Csa_019341 [Cucumis sativus]|uniref:Uncharacterized protein n=1 Tax=Cucumis sativus TaxID=3659 RepID=A0A0A0LIS3_CUCSA|nr:hypothetical protein Csa_019341 [Cucumis sativus]